MTSILITIVIVLIIAIFFIADKYYWKGRNDGWWACEKMICKRAIEHNYPATFYEDIVQ